MKISYTFRHMDSSDSLRKHTANKLSRLKRFEDREMTVHAVFEVARHSKKVEFIVHATNGKFVSHEERADMHEAIDLAIDKLDRALSRDKAKRKHHKGHQAATDHRID